MLVVKARQLGISWTVQAHLLYQGYFWGNRLFLICSQTGGDAVDALHRHTHHARLDTRRSWRPQR